MPTKGLLDRLKDGEAVIIAEGYLHELERRCYLKAGCYVPEVVLKHPDLVRNLHREYVHAGSDVVLALTYYGHREKMRLIDREADLEKLNRQALQIAREVADETGTLMAGNICNSTMYKPGDPVTKKLVMDMAVEQVKWAVEGGADFILGETYFTYEEATIGLEAIKKIGNGLPAVINLAVSERGLYDGVDPADACCMLKEKGADVVGLNCSRGPATMLPLIKQVRQKCAGPMACIPVPYRTDEDHVSFQALPDVDDPEVSAFPNDLDPWACSRNQIRKFGIEAWNLGIQILGVCCGNRASYIRTLAEAVGRTPPASIYSPDMTQHYSRLNDDRHRAEFQQYNKDFSIKIHPTGPPQQ